MRVQNRRPTTVTANAENAIKIPWISGLFVSGLMVFGAGHQDGLEAMVHVTCRRLFRSVLSRTVLLNAYIYICPMADDGQGIGGRRRDGYVGNEEQTDRQTDGTEEGTEEGTNERKKECKEGTSTRPDQTRPDHTRPGKVFQSPQSQIPCTHTSPYQSLGGSFPPASYHLGTYASYHLGSNVARLYCTYKNCSKIIRNLRRARLLRQTR